MKELAPFIGIGGLVACVVNAIRCCRLIRIKVRGNRVRGTYILAAQGFCWLVEGPNFDLVSQRWNVVKHTKGRLVTIPVPRGRKSRPTMFYQYQQSEDYWRPYLNARQTSRTLLLPLLWLPSTHIWGKSIVACDVVPMEVKTSWSLLIVPTISVPRPPEPVAIF